MIKNAILIISLIMSRALCKRAEVTGQRRVKLMTFQLLTPVKPQMGMIIFILIAVCLEIKPLHHPSYSLNLCSDGL